MLPFLPFIEQSYGIHKDDKAQDIMDYVQRTGLSIGSCEGNSQQCCCLKKGREFH